MLTKTDTSMYEALPTAKANSIYHGRMLYEIEYTYCTYNCENNKSIKTKWNRILKILY